MIRFADDITIIEAAMAAASIGAKLVATPDGDVVIKRRAHAARLSDNSQTRCRGPLHQTYHRAVTTHDGVTHLLQGGPGRRDGDDRYWGDLVWCDAEPLDGPVTYTNGPVTCQACLRARDAQFAEWRAIGLID